MMKRTVRALIVLQVSVIGVASVTALQQPGVLTDTDRLRVMVVALQRELADAQAEGDVCRAVLGPLRARANQEQIKRSEEAAIAAIEAVHPGFTFDRQTGRLVAVPPEPPNVRK